MQFRFVDLPGTPPDGWRAVSLMAYLDHRSRPVFLAEVIAPAEIVMELQRRLELDQAPASGDGPPFVILD